MSWLRLFELFIIISLIVFAIKIGSEKIEVEEERDELAKTGQSSLYVDIATRYAAKNRANRAIAIGWHLLTKNPPLM